METSKPVASTFLNDYRRRGRLVFREAVAPHVVAIHIVRTEFECVAARYRRDRVGSVDRGGRPRSTSIQHRGQRLR